MTKRKPQPFAVLKRKLAALRAQPIADGGETGHERQHRHIAAEVARQLRGVRLMPAKRIRLGGCA